MSDNELKDYGVNKAVVNATVQWPDMRLSEQIKHLRFFRDKDNNIVVMPVVLMDPTQTGLNVLPMGRVGISDPTTVNSYARVFGLPCCGWPETTLGLVTHSTKMVQDGVNLVAQRTPTIMRQVQVAAAGNTAIWTPVAGNRFHLMALLLHLGLGSAAAAGQTIDITDGAGGASIFRFNISPGALAATTALWSIYIPLPENGWSSAAINLALTCNLANAFTAGTLNITAFGYEQVA